MNCKNCQEEFEGKFCSNCGQNSKVGKINYEHVVNEISESVFQLNHGLLFTIKELFFRPGIRIKDYLDGKRKNYFKPIAYVLLLSTIYGLLSTLVDQGTFIGETVRGISATFAKEMESNRVSGILYWIANNHAYATLILLPFFAISSYLAFMSFKLNYFEHIIINAYITGQQAIIYSLFAILQAVTKSQNYLISLIPLFLSLALAFWTFYKVFGKIKWLKAILLTILTYLIYDIFIFGFITVIIIVGKIST